MEQSILFSVRSRTLLLVLGPWLITSGFAAGAADQAAESRAPEKRLLRLLDGGEPVSSSARLHAELLVDRHPEGAGGTVSRLLVQLLDPVRDDPAAGHPPVALHVGVRLEDGRNLHLTRQLTLRETQVGRLGELAIDFTSLSRPVRCALIAQRDDGERVAELAVPASIADLGPLRLPGRVPEPVGERLAIPPLRVLVESRPVLGGEQVVGALVHLGGVGRIRYFLDGRLVGEALREPWKLKVELDSPPRPQTLEAVAYDRDGLYLASDAAVLNESVERAWIRVLLSPSRTEATHASMKMGIPRESSLLSVQLFAGQRLLAELSEEPFVVGLPDDVDEELFLYARLNLRDGTSVEDVAMIGPEGFGEGIETSLAEVYPSILGWDGKPTEVVAQDLIVVDAGEERPVRSVRPGDELPLLLGLVIDTSGSMHSVASSLQRQAATLLEPLEEGRDRAFLLTVGQAVVLRQAPTSNRRLLIRSLDGLQAWGSTPLLDAILQGLLRFDRRSPLQALVVVTDGRDNSSELDVFDVLDVARRLSIPIFVFVVVEHVSETPSPLSLRPLLRLCAQSGGELIQINRSDRIPEEFAGILDRLKNRSVVVFEPSRKEREPGSWRRVEIRSRKPGVKVEGELGYFAADD